MGHGKHTFKFGGEYNHFIYSQFFLPRSVGDYAYSSTQRFINDQIPDVRALRDAGSGYFLGTTSLMAGFVQDDFKVSPRLTLNLGVRYEYWTNPVGDKEWSRNAISDVPGVITFRNPKTDKNNVQQNSESDSRAGIAQSRHLSAIWILRKRYLVRAICQQHLPCRLY